jgi:hypothetical protein
MSTPLNITCRIEEVPAIGGMIISSLESLLSDFTAYSPDYTPTYLTNIKGDLTTVEGLINPKQLTAELKIITNRIYSNQATLRLKIDLLEGYINRATALTIDKKDFGISALRTKNNNRDVEGTIAALSFLLTNVSNNMAALTAKGYTTAQNTALTTIQSQLKSDNIAQNNKINDRNNKVISNYGKINAFWAKLTDICDAGKRIYKSSAPNKVDDFTMAVLKRRVNQERTNTKFMGGITSGTTPLKGAKIEMLPLAGGRRRVATSKATGEYLVPSLIEGDYIVNVTASGKTPQTINITIAKGQTTSHDFNLV